MCQLAISKCTNDKYVMKNYKDNLIVKLTFELALNIVEFADELQSKRKYVVADQVLRSGCSVGALVRESQNAESRADFIHKLKIAAKEAEETEFWLELCHHSKTYSKPGKLLEEVNSVIKVLGKIISSAKKSKIGTSTN
jgi:four helix bundle protein